MGFGKLLTDRIFLIFFFFQFEMGQPLHRIYIYILVFPI